MPKPQHKAHPHNVPGPFYVEDGCCLWCDVPRSIAPEMFKYTDDQQHCFVHTQPSTGAELQKVIEVLKTQDIGCIRCRSQNCELLKQLTEEGLRHICDFETKA